MALPGDTPNAYLYANVRDRGLSITSLATQNPRLHNQHFEKARNSDDPIVKIAANWEFSVRNWDRLRIAKEAQPAEQSDSIEVSTPAEETTVRGDNKESENEIWKLWLHSKCDSKDLKNFSTDIAQQHTKL